MKNRLYFLLILIMILTGCKSNETKGVPDSVVISDLQFHREYSLDEDYTIYHNVDSESHIDTVTCENLYEETEYARQYYIIPCRYQYDRGTDVWTLLGYGDSTRKTELKEAIYVQEAWTGFYDNPYKDNQFSYSLTVDSINTELLRITLSNYVLIYNGGTVSQTTPVILDLSYSEDMRCYTFEIDLSSIDHSLGYTIFELSEDGLVPCDFGE